MLKIRLQRVGRKHEPAFRLVLTDSENSTKSGRTTEVLGSYDPRKSVDVLKKDRISYWLEKGALATGSVHNLLVNHKIISAKKVNVLPKKTVEAKAPEAAPEAAVETAPVTPAAEAVADTTPEPEAPVATEEAAPADAVESAPEATTPESSESTAETSTE